MKINTNKRKIKFLFTLFIVSTFIVGGFLIYKKTVESPYTKLFRYCTNEEEGIGIQNCKVFLDNYYQNNKGHDCLDIVLPEINAKERNVSLCFKKNINLEWENPYDDYLLNIPVIIQIGYNEFPIFKIRNIKAEIMSDNEAHQLVDPINKKTEEIILFRSARATKEIEEKGYYLSTGVCYESISNRCDRFTVYKAELSDYYLENNDFIFEVNIPILGKEIKEIIKVDSFQFVEYSYKSIEKPLKREIIDIDSDIEKFLSKKDVYVMEFYLDGYEKITESLIEEYSIGNIDLDLILTQIIKYVD